MKRVAILSHVVIDEIHTADGATLPDSLGGAGTYAAVGASLVGECGSSTIVAGAGSEDHAAVTSWFADRGIATDGLFVSGARSPRTRIDYEPSGERTETSLLGPAHFEALTPLPRHIPPPPAGFGSVYLFHDHEADYWAEVERARTAYAGPWMWEIASNACRPDLLDQVLDRLSTVDVLSINLAEALELFAAPTLDIALERLADLDVVSVLRAGGAGSFVVTGEAVHHVGIADSVVVDPTGGGNSYSGAFLATFAETGDAVLAGQCAAAAAAVVIAGPGAPSIDDRLREQTRASAQRILTPKH